MSDKDHIKTTDGDGETRHKDTSEPHFADLKVDGSRIAPDTVASLNNNGVILSSQIPDLAITETHTVADQSARLALDVEEGDVAIQTDTSETYIFTGGDPSNDSDWSLIVSEPSPHSTSHEKGGSDELTTFGDTTHDSVNTDELNTTLYVDSGADLQTALDDAEAAGGGTVVVTSSTTYPNPVEQPTSVALVGGQEAGYDVGNNTAHGTVLTAENAAPMHQWRDSDGNVDPASRSRGVYGGRIENFVFDGASTATTGADWHGIQRCRAENVGFVDCTGNAWHVRGEDYQGGGVFYNHLKSILGLRGDRGLVMENNGRRANDNLIQNAYLSRCQKEGLDIADCHGNNIDADVALNLQDGTYDPTTNGSADDPLGRTEAVFRDGAERNTADLWIEQGTDAGVYIGSNVEGTNVFGQSTAGGDPDWYFASDAGRGNIIWASVSMQEKSATNTVMVYPIGVSNIEPSAVSMAHDGKPVRQTGNFNTTASGHYAGIEIEVLAFDGTTAGSGAQVDSWVGFMT